MSCATKTLFLLTALVAACCLRTCPAAEPIYVFRFDDEGAAADWRHKENTTVAIQSADPREGHGALRFEIDPAKWSYGWVHSPLPQVDMKGLAAISGYFRAPQGAAGQLRLHLCLQSGAAGLSYFRADLGRLSDSNGQWVEFCVALPDLIYERGPIRSLTPAALTSRDLIQFLASIEGRKPAAVDLDSVAFLAEPDAQAVVKRVAKSMRMRMLLSEAETVSARHPRLFFTPDRLSAYRAKASTGDERQAAYDRLIECAESLLRSYNADDPLQALYGFVENDQRKSREWSGALEGHLLNASYPIEILGAAYRLTGDKKFGDHGAKALANAAKRLTTDEPFLRRGFYYTRTLYVRALAFGYDWLCDRLGPDDRRQVRATLLGFVEDIHTHSQSDGWGRRPLHRVWNWDPGLMGACGVGMLALEGETRLPEQAILFDCRRHLRDYLTLGIDEDGCGHEGPNYLGYGIGAGVEFVEVLRRQGRGDLFTETNYRLIPPWLIAETLPDGTRWNNLSDCGHGQRAWPAYLYACGRLAELAKSDPCRPGERWSCPAQIAPLGYLQQFMDAPGPRRISYGALAGMMGWEWRCGPGHAPPAKYDARTALAHVLLYEPCPVIEDPGAVLPFAMHFRGRGLVVSRTGFGPDALHFAVEAGPHAAGHDQCDKGTFTLRAYGADLAIDSGYGNDGEPQKSGSSYAHNVVLIDGEGQPMRYHNQSSGKITGFFHHSLLDWVRADAREAWGVRYDGDWRPTPTTPVQRAERQFVLVRPSDGVPPYLVVYDDIIKDAAQQHDYTWQWHIPADMRFKTAGDRWTAECSPMNLAVLTTGSEGPAGSAIFRLPVETGGRYIVYGLVRAGGESPGKSDSFFVTMDDDRQLLWDLRVGSKPAWSAVADREESEPHVFDLKPGEHVLRLDVRERQAELAGWLAMPEGTPLPLDPMGTPKGAIRLGIEKAELAKAGFEVRPPIQDPSPKATMDVFPVHPSGGKVETDWFLTSREGAHPRLWYTVRAAEPRILVVMVPRLPDTPCPRVSVLPCEGGVGVNVEWPAATDRLIFARDKANGDGIAMIAAAAFVRVRNGQVNAWGLLDGRRLAFGEQTLCWSEKPTVRCELPR